MMAESAGLSQDSNTPKAPKDKSCPFCGQAFTSSSLGRHLDLYIKEKNPKQPDGIHDVDEIRKLRGGITRRQARTSLRKDTSTPGGTPAAASRKSPASEVGSATVRSPAQQREASHSAAQSITSRFPFAPSWEATGVINDIPGKTGEGSRGGDAEGTPDPTRRAVPQRAVSRQVAKAQFDMKQRVQDALDTARAAELALREIISSWRAAKQQIDMNSMPFDFEPLSLDFPALCLQCLTPPPTLFSSTQHPTPTSWSISSPGQKQFDALKAYFQQEFHKWKIQCAAATTAIHEELSYPPTQALHSDVKEAVRRAEKTAEALEKQVTEHLQSAFSVWEALSPQRRQELWILELARSVGRKQKEVDKLKEEQHSLRSEIANLKSQVDALNRLQQPKEFKIMTPVQIPFKEDGLMFLQEEGLKGRRGVGLNMDDRHSDLTTVVGSAIERWKSVIISARAASGMSQQKPLDQPSTPAPLSANVATSASTPNLQQTHQMQQSQAPVPTLQQPQPRTMSTTSSTGPALTATSENRTSAAPTPSVQSIDETSDQDADADMDDDDGFSAMSTPITKQPPTQPQVPEQQTSELHIPRARGPPMARGGGSRFAAVNAGQQQRSASHAGHGRGGGVGPRGPIRNMNQAAMRHVTHNVSQAQHNNLQDPNFMQGLNQGEPMYMD